MRHPLWSFPLLSVWALSGCTDPNGSLVELQTAIEPDATCSYQTSNGVSSNGFYDPIRASNGGYILAMLARNNMEQSSDETYTIGATNIHWRTRDAIVTGWDVCWDADPNAYSAYTARQSVEKGAVLDCAALAKAGKAFALPGNGTVAEGGLTQSILTTYVLTPAHLKTLFGADFDAGRLPKGFTYALNGNQFYDRGSNAADPNRVAAWGTFPTSGSATVIVQLRARFTTQGGIQGTSNWLVYPIDVCPGCTYDFCGSLIYGACYRCEFDELGCNSTNKCNSDQTTACKPGRGFTGVDPDYTASGSAPCLIEQGFTPPQCTLTGTFQCKDPNAI